MSKKFPNIIVNNTNKGVARIILNDPDTYNTLSFVTIKSLINCFKNLDQDKSTKVIIIEGSGKGFCAGHNLKEIKFLKGKSNYQKLFSQCSKLMMQIISIKKPVIANK